jgi:hypothetical protein
VYWSLVAVKFNKKLFIDILLWEKEDLSLTPSLWACVYTLYLRRISLIGQLLQSNGKVRSLFFLNYSMYFLVVCCAHDENICSYCHDTYQDPIVNETVICSPPNFARPPRWLYTFKNSWKRNMKIYGRQGTWCVYEIWMSLYLLISYCGTHIFKYSA